MKTVGKTMMIGKTMKSIGKTMKMIGKTGRSGKQ